MKFCLRQGVSLTYNFWSFLSWIFQVYMISSHKRKKKEKKKTQYWTVEEKNSKFYYHWRGHTKWQDNSLSTKVLMIQLTIMDSNNNSFRSILKKLRYWKRRKFLLNTKYISFLIDGWHILNHIFSFIFNYEDKNFKKN